MQTLGQKRAAFALKKVNEKIQDAVSNLNKEKKEKFYKEFKSLTSGMPSMILMNGFGQALAFISTKKEDKYKIILDIVMDWLSQQNFIQNTGIVSNFLLKISQMEQKNYLDAQKEALALLEWVKRFAAMEAVEAGV